MFATVRLSSSSARMALTSDPGWVFNLRARPEAEIELNRTRMHVRARVLTGVERVRAWHGITSQYAFFNVYQSAISRAIPVVRLDVAPPSTAAKSP